MGPQRETDASDDRAESADSIESLLRSTDRDTEEIVDALRESGPRQHVSETNVDEILTDLSEPQAGETDDEYALPGGPTRTVSTSGIDEVFETLEADAPSLPPEPQVDASGSSGGGDSGVNGTGGAPTAVAANSSGGTTASADRSGSTAVTFDPADGDESDDDAEPFGRLVGGEPTRTIVDESVDDILDSLEDGSPGSTDERAERESDEPVDDLRPDDPEGELVDLLAGDEPEPEPTAEPESSASATGESGPEETGTVESADDTTEIDDAAAKLARTDTAAESGTPADDASGAEFEWVDPAADARENERASTPTTDSAPGSTDAVAGEASRPLVTRAELEEIAGLVSGSESTDEPDPGPTTESTSEPDSGREPGPDAPSDDEVEPISSGSSARSTAGPGAAREAVSVDAVIAPTETLGPSAPVADAEERTTVPSEQSKPAAAADGAESPGPSAPGTDSDGSSPLHRARTVLRRLLGRLRR